MAGSLPDAFLVEVVFFGIYMSAASVMPKRLWKVTFLWLTLSLFGNVLSHSLVKFNFCSCTTGALYTALPFAFWEKLLVATTNKPTKNNNLVFILIAFYNVLIFCAAKLQAIFQSIGGLFTKEITKITD